MMLFSVLFQVSDPTFPYMRAKLPVVT